MQALEDLLLLDKVANDDEALSLSGPEFDLLANLEDLAPQWVANSDAAHQRLTQLRAARQPVPPPAGPQAELRPYQRQGFAWLQHLRNLELGGILADDMDLAKPCNV